MAFTLLPAVDVADGRAVGLVQGEADTTCTYGDPRDAALAWQAAGAEWIHLVDQRRHGGAGGPGMVRTGDRCARRARRCQP